MDLKYKFLILLLVTAFVPMMINSTIDLTVMRTLLADLVEIDDSSLIRHIERIASHLEKKTIAKLIRDAFTLTAIGVAVITVAIIISTRLTRPMTKLADMSRQLKKGNFSARSNIKRRDEIGKLAKAFDEMAPALAERMRMERSLGLAGQAQQYLMSHADIKIDGFDIAGRNIPCDETGGDYFDIIAVDRVRTSASKPKQNADSDPTEETHVEGVIVLGDVCGHGIAAALQMATSRALLRGFVETTPALDHKMNRLNRHLNRDLDDGQFVTMFCLQITSQSIDWCSAGHEPALFLPNGKDKAEELSQRALPLGIDKNYRYRQQSLKNMKKGSILAILSDGIGDTRNAAGKFYGRKKIESLVRRYRDHSATQICDAILQDMKKFRGKEVMYDDATIMVVKAKGRKAYAGSRSKNMAVEAKGEKTYEESRSRSKERSRTAPRDALVASAA